MAYEFDIGMVHLPILHLFSLGHVMSSLHTISATPLMTVSATPESTPQRIQKASRSFQREDALAGLGSPTRKLPQSTDQGADQHDPFHAEYEKLQPLHISSVPQRSDIS